MTPVRGIRWTSRPLHHLGLAGKVFFDESEKTIKAAYGATLTDGRSDSSVRSALDLLDVPITRINNQPDGLDPSARYVLVGTNGIAYHNPLLPWTDGKTLEVKANLPYLQGTSPGYGTERLTISFYYSSKNIILDHTPLEDQILALIAGRLRESGLISTEILRTDFPPGYITPRPI